MFDYGSNASGDDETYVVFSLETSKILFFFPKTNIKSFKTSTICFRYPTKTTKLSVFG